MYPQVRSEVSKIDLEHVEEARFVRENIERGIVRLACHVFPDEYTMQLETNITMQEFYENKQDYENFYKLDDTFHQILFVGTNKKRTWHMLQQMSTHFNRLRLLRLTSDLTLDVLIIQHRKILQLLKNKDEQSVDEVVAEHLNLAVVEKEVLIKQYPTYFK
ncbi:GntR family transcriptional regulator [Aquibacillus sp. 3ASR75-11]|uniref:GntR family transcriptional regulator n=1 Tax=Terrihalobacillus insolitus TaxID=2950438 RepID=A0A9X3WTR1_9BACI|nr:GntR family transcriptional regulator [Terrihalobacillus insolitus]MDC3423254.1 GntR family transcriptional regulator [Terrihalobacillus insolitus]